MLYYVHAQRCWTPVILAAYWREPNDLLKSRKDSGGIELASSDSGYKT